MLLGDAKEEHFSCFHSSCQWGFKPFATLFIWIWGHWTSSLWHYPWKFSENTTTSNSVVTLFYCGVAKQQKVLIWIMGKKWDISYLPTALVQGQEGQHAQQWHEIGGGCHRHFTPSLQTSRAQTGKRILIHSLLTFCLLTLSPFTTENDACILVALNNINLSL